MEEKLSALYAAERARLHAAAARGRTGEYEAPVFGEGPLHPRLMLLGEAPGAEETRLGRPFVGKAGKKPEYAACTRGDHTHLRVCDQRRQIPANECESTEHFQPAAFSGGACRGASDIKRRA